MNNKHERQPGQETSVIRVGKALIGGADPVVIAGPCAVESLEQLTAVAQALKENNIPCLRAGAFKPRTSPYSFQGMGKEGLVLLDMVRNQFDLAIVSEVMAEDQIEIADPFVDCFQVGSRNMQNFNLLKALGKTDKPILLKRGIAATVQEFLLAAEYIMSEGNQNVILCERGIRSFDPSTRNVLDLAAVALLKELSHLPVIVDPSHATGKRSLIAPTSLAALAVGADGLIIEAHPQPEKSVSDADQAIDLPELAALMPRLDRIAKAVDRKALALA